MTVFIIKGDAPMSVRQAVKRGLRHFEAQRQRWEREQGIVTSDPEYMAWAAQWVADNEVNRTNNLFNHQLAAYRKAVERLARYRVSEGRPDIYEDQPTGEFDPETGEEIVVTVLVQAAVEPLEATVEEPVFDPETGEQTGTQIVPNPLIVADEAERAQAQVVINATPDDVKLFDANS